MMVIIFILVLKLPYPEAFENYEAYNIVLGTTPRNLVASLIGFLFGNFLNSIILSKLYNQLVLGGNEYEKLSNIIKNLYKNETNTKLPNKEYIKMMLDAIIHKEKVIYNCFAGDSLFFLTPDGAIHPCPSSKIIPNEKETIKVHENRLKDIFINKKIKIKKCNKFSEDCVNMWQLMSFDEILQ